MNYKTSAPDELSITLNWRPDICVIELVFQHLANFALSAEVENINVERGNVWDEQTQQYMPNLWQVRVFSEKNDSCAPSETVLGACVNAADAIDRKEKSKC